MTSYVVLGLTLAWSRFWSLDHSFWHDEIVAVADFIRLGPREILAGPGLSHELFGVLAWATTSVFGESEFGIRLWSAVPFVLGVAIVTVWLHRRLGFLSGVLFLFLATLSPLLLDITRQARGYGLAFLAMSVVIVAALEANRAGRTWSVVAFCVAGVLGTWTLPQLGIAFLATGVVLLTDRDLRRRAALGLGASIVAIGAWFAPHLGEVGGGAQLGDGVRIHTLWLLTAPIDQVLVPAFLWIDGTALVAGPIWLPVIAVAALLIGSSPLLRDRRTALILCTGAFATVLALWITQADVIPRYLSFLLVPLLVLVSTGMASILGRIGARPAIVRTIVAFAVIGLVIAKFVSTAPEVVQLPREAYRNAAETIELRGWAASPVLAYLRNPQGLRFYLDAPVRELEPSEVASSICESRESVVYVTQPFGIPPVEVPCLNRAGVVHQRFRQYARGDEMNVWFVPPSR